MLPMLRVVIFPSMPLLRSAPAVRQTQYSPQRLQYNLQLRAFGEQFSVPIRGSKVNKKLPRSFMITAESPMNTIYNDISSRVPPRIQEEQNDDTITKRPTMGVVILTTPSFATWIEDDVFMADLLDRILYTGTLYVNVVAAVVDRIPAADHSASPGKEGFAVLHGTAPYVLPDFNRCPSATAGSQSSIIFSFNRCFEAIGTRYVRNKKKDFKELPKSIVLPLAKTIFQNGRESTFIASEWEKPRGSLLPHKVSVLIKASERVLALPIGSAFLSSVELIPLTMPRKIISSMGNIIRQLEVKDGGKTVVPASQELEANISDYFERSNLSPRAVSVWAQITSNGQPCARPSDKPGKDTSQTLDLFFNEASSIHRVLSGGGGWGLKQGLVSLDPQSEVEFTGQPKNTEYTIASQKEALGDIAPQNFYIQYFLAADATSEVFRRNQIRKKLKWERSRKKSPNSIELKSQRANCTQYLDLGMTPSPVDQLNSTLVSLGSTKPADDAFHVYTNYFGALSEHGIFFVQEDGRYNRIRSSKIDIPGSFISSQFTNTSDTC